MAMLRIQKKRIENDRHYFLDSGEMVGRTYYRGRHFFRYKAATFHEGRERYVLQIDDPRSLPAFSMVLLGSFLPKDIQNIMIVPIIATLLFFPSFSSIWADGRLVARERKRRFQIGQDCYEFRHHSGYKSSLMKNGVQIALYTMKTAYGVPDPPYEILYDERTPLDIIILFCLYLDMCEDITLKGKGPWKDWVPWDRHREQIKWRPPEPSEPAQQNRSTNGLPTDSTD